MPKRAIALSSEARDAVSQLHPGVKRKVRAAIDAIRDDPTVGDPLEQELSGFRKIVIGSWRIVYREEAHVVRIHAIGRRATVYSPEPASPSGVFGSTSSPAVHSGRPRSTTRTRPPVRTTR